MNVTECVFQVGAANARDFPSDGLPEIALAGRSNVGKSALVNRLVGARRLARTSKTPGRTRQINFFRVNDRFYLVDLPGYGYAKVPRRVKEQWRGLVEDYLARRDRIALVLQLIDARRGPTGPDRDLAGWLDAAGLPRGVVLTKVDKLSGNGRVKALEGCAGLLGPAPGSEPVVTSSVTREGIPDLWRLIDGVCDARRSRFLTVPSGAPGGASHIRGCAAPSPAAGERH